MSLGIIKKVQKRQVSIYNGNRQKPINNLTSEKTKISRSAYKENFCGTFPARSSIPPAITCFVPLLSGIDKIKQKSKNQGALATEAAST